MLGNGAPYIIVYVDAFELTYERRFRALQNRLRFRSDGATNVTVDGFTSEQILLFDITDPRHPATLSAIAIHPDGAEHALSFRPESEQREYLGVAVEAVATPAAVWPARLPALRDSTGADYLVIAPGSLLGAAERLVQHREARGLRSLLVGLEEIYDEFSHGLSTPRAIRDFLVHAYWEWTVPPRYVVLVGSGSYDYRDVLGLGTNLVPPLLSTTPYGLFASDLALGDVALGDVAGADGVPEIAVGRIPALTPEELHAYIDKLEAFEAQGELPSVLLLADRADVGAGDFAVDCDALLPRIPHGWDVRRIYLSETPVAAAREQLFDSLDPCRSTTKPLGSTTRSSGPSSWSGNRPWATPCARPYPRSCWVARHPR